MYVRMYDLIKFIHAYLKMLFIIELKYWVKKEFSFSQLVNT